MRLITLPTDWLDLCTRLGRFFPFSGGHDRLPFFVDLAPRKQFVGYVRRVNKNGTVDVVMGPVSRLRRWWWRVLGLVGL
jgi:hypothetical protein